MADKKTVTCPHCHGTGIDPFDDGGTLAAKPPCNMCQGKMVIESEEPTDAPGPDFPAPEPEPVEQPLAGTAPAEQTAQA